MKLKYYLRGLGIGILVTTLILMIAYRTKDKMSDKELLEEASKRGYELTMEKDTLFADQTKEPSDNKETTTVEETTTIEETTTVEETTTIAETTVAETTTPEETTANEKNETLIITGGMYSNAVATKLQELGIIANAKDFDMYLEKNGYSERIMTGAYNVNSNMSYEEIAKMITK